MLISRVACIAKLQHKPIGYSGPLSRQLLCYRSLISEVRAALRNLIEVVLAGLLLSGDAERDRKDWAELGIKYGIREDDEMMRLLLILVAGCLLLTITTVAWALPCAPIWMICPCRLTLHHPRLGTK